MKDLIIIGGGAAGITAGIYAARKYIDALLITSDFTGQIGKSSWVENYPGLKKITGLDLIKNFKEHLDMFPLEKKAFENIEKIEKTQGGFSVVTDEGAYETRALIIASGNIPRKLNVKNEDKFLGKGVSYCVTCDEAGYKGKTVAVTGGGNAGFEAAIELGRFCEKVYLLETADALAADMILQKEAEENNKIEIIVSVDILSFAGAETLEKVVFINKKTQETKELKIEGCFVEIGTCPNTDFVKGFLDLNEKGEIKVDPINFETSVPGCFAAGDVNNLPGKQIVIACGQGASALLSAYKYLNNNND
ncbi:MAG: Thioredoxin-disulfide reductase [Candidatus Falkowbacteria bacterium GW2011_GWC2_38_22]|uniref:Thioredoxin-disulfide reductase n=1 Tax=Candidatus Falkowbacteria bacterium GW2011_GWE1_38_31 TaxID=1618638 RepID=A0A0G0JPB9_9BACT|nr:MAG: Thioredoxin-disulfide reductase [Candidatus Falkowbacteria bacterium GW2011_GWF2_38_1205]KKQ60464.1 MAG: Thioredoxin-disulfide reductase [Candidatus Falkowbacteria bacterium GW2011_GWC2_38_22]KKQ62525.1 MAG: Thioredoxin-disulfide reductase [Candidatus Falkowbacteria bacterium GW2011_GWF1_38_22]KKQ64586.1 MAG: Thioredoxin-disulfide reductase [Candidatus Falkowbacteria bacterium GW2011_GWE2_38_254]KKQ69418.1 MAG: Thioredoxin-disulfide reductase [Candidatus Falkowbacteria bacterium GW2011_